MEKDTIDNGEEIPKSMSQIQKFFRDCNPRNDGGRIYTAMCIAFQNKESNLLYNIRSATKGSNIFMQKRALQKAFTETAGWLMFGYNDMDVMD